MRTRLFLLYFVAIAFISVYYVHVSPAKKDGIYSQSRIGCGAPNTDCHGASANRSQNTSVHLWTDAPEIHPGDTVLFHISVINPTQSQLAAANAGCNISVSSASNLKLFGTSSGLKASSASNPPRQLTHTIYKRFTGNDSVTWDFNYIAPSESGTAYIYAAGNAGNGDDRATSADQWNTTIDTLTIVDAPAAVERSAEQSVQVYPNPTSGPLFINSIDAGEATVQVTDESGRNVMSKRVMLSQKTPLDLSSLAKGTYIVRILPKNGAAVTKRVTVYK